MAGRRSGVESFRASHKWQAIFSRFASRLAFQRRGHLTMRDVEQLVSRTDARYRECQRGKSLSAEPVPVGDVLSVLRRLISCRR